MSFTSQHLCGQIMQLGYFSEGEAVYAPSHSGVSSYGRRGARLPGRFSGSPSVIDGEPLRTHHWESRAPAALIWISTAIATICLPTTHAWAHVKWFAPYDVTQSPAIAGDVLTRHFVLIFAAFTSLLIASFLLDGLAGRWGRLLTTTGKLEDLEERLLRSGTGAFFMALFATGGVILTPELRTGADWAIWLQFGIAVSMLSQRTCLLGGLGILGLYGFGIVTVWLFSSCRLPDVSRPFRLPGADVGDIRASAGTAYAYSPRIDMCHPDVGCGREMGLSTVDLPVARRASVPDIWAIA